MPIETCRQSPRRGAPGGGRSIGASSCDLHVVVDVDQVQVTPPADDDDAIANDDRLGRAPPALQVIVGGFPVAGGAVGADLSGLDGVEMNGIVASLGHSGYDSQKRPLSAR